MNVKACHVWFGLSLVAAVGTVFSFMNLWAAVDLAYDTTPRGKTILNGWCFAFISFCLGTLVFVALAVRSWLVRRGGPHFRAEMGASPNLARGIRGPILPRWRKLSWKLKSENEMKILEGLRPN